MSEPKMTATPVPIGMVVVTAPDGTALVMMKLPEQGLVVQGPSIPAVMRKAAAVIEAAMAESEAAAQREEQRAGVVTHKGLIS